MKIILSIIAFFTISLQVFAGRWYVKAMGGRGIAFDKIPLYVTYTPNPGASPQDVTIRPGGGIRGGVTLGYCPTPKYAFEIFLSTQYETEEPNIELAHSVFYESQMALTFYDFFTKWKMFDIYCGGGLSYFFRLSMYVNAPNIDIETEGSAHYYDSPGIHGLIGMQSDIFKNVPLKYFAEFRLEAGTRFKFKELNHIEISPFPNWNELNGDQIFFNLGLLYYFPFEFVLI
jgi:hypothetical protein